MGIGTLGFLKGASKTALDSIQAREEAENELKKQKQLEQFRADLEQQKAMAKATSFQIEKDPDTGKMRTVGYNSQGQRLNNTARDSTQSEIDSETQRVEDRKYTLEDRGRKAKRDDQVYNYADEDQRMQRESHGLGLQATKAQIAASNRSGRGSIDSMDSESDNPEMVTQDLLNANPTIFKQLTEMGYTPESIFSATRKVVLDTNAKQKAGQNTSATREFMDMVDRLRRFNTANKDKFPTK